MTEEEGKGKSVLSIVSLSLKCAGLFGGLYGRSTNNLWSPDTGIYVYVEREINSNSKSDSRGEFNDPF